MKTSAAPGRIKGIITVKGKDGRVKARIPFVGESPGTACEPPSSPSKSDTSTKEQVK